MVITTKAVVISSIKYGDSDIIVRCYTASSGLKSYLLRGLLKSKKGKLKNSYFQPLTLLEIEAVHKDKGNLERIKEAKISIPLIELHTQIIKSSLVIFLAEVLNNALQESHEDLALYQFLENSLVWLDHAEQFSNFHILFLLKLSMYLGFYPDSTTSSQSFFNLAEGKFQEYNDGKYCVHGKHVECLKEFFGIDFEAISRIKPTKIIRLEILNLLLVYYQLHLQSFKKPKSLLVLNKIFE